MAKKPMKALFGSYFEFWKFQSWTICHLNISGHKLNGNFVQLFKVRSNMLISTVFKLFWARFEQNQLKIVKNMQTNTFLSQLWRAPQHSRLIFGPKYLNGRYFKIKASKTRSMNQKGLSLIFGPSPSRSKSKFLEWY